MWTKNIAVAANMCLIKIERRLFINYSLVIWISSSQKEDSQNLYFILHLKSTKPTLKNIRF